MLRLHRHGRRGLLVVVLGVVLSCAPPDATGPSGGNPPPPANAKSWSNPATWPGHHLPAAGDSVVIPAGVTVKLDANPPPLQSITVEGTLYFANQDITLTTGWILVDGTLRIGTATAPYRNRALITLTGSPGNADIRGVGNKMIGVSGVLDIHGETRTGKRSSRKFRSNETIAPAALAACLSRTRRSISWRRSLPVVVRGSASRQMS